MQVKDKDCKKIDEEMLARKRKEITLDHDRMFSGEDGLADQSQVLVAQSLVRGCSASVAESVGGGGESSSAFYGRFQDVNFTELEGLTHVEAEEEPDQVQETNTGGKSDDDNGNGEPKKSKGGKSAAKGSKKSWDKDRVVAAKIRTDSAALEDLENSLNSKKTDAQKLLNELKSKSAACQAEVAVEEALVVRRVAFILLVLAEDSAALNNKIKFVQAAAQEQHDGQPPLSAMPPCASYEDLKTISSLKESIQGYWSCDSSASLILGLTDLH